MPSLYATMVEAADRQAESMDEAFKAVVSELKRLEWCRYNYLMDEPGCPGCHHTVSMKHAPDCTLAAALRKAGAL